VITGAALVVVGLLVGLSGSTRINFGTMALGWDDLDRRRGVLDAPPGTA
jgi:hypothetical protein